MSPDVRVSNVEQKTESAFATGIPPTAGVARDNTAPSVGRGSNRYASGEAERLAMRTASRGAGGANETEAGAPGVNNLSDADLALSALSAIERSALLPTGKVLSVVRNGWLILAGEVEESRQKRTAEDAVRGLKGIRGVSNNILIESEALAQRVGQKIGEAFVRSALVHAHHISVTACDHKIILSGCVRSLAEREEAEMAARAVPGVAHVVNRLRATD